MSKYFLDLNYSMANEDTALERDIILKTRPKKIVSVCGSGSRSLPLIHPTLEELHIVDLSKEQLMLAKLRIETILNLTHQEFLMFWGYAPFDAAENNNYRKQLFLRFDLNKDEEVYFLNLFNARDWESILYSGKWEKTFILFSKVIQKFLGKDICEELFSFDDLEKQQDFIKNKFPKYKWLLILSVLGNKSMFNALLYKGHFIKKNVEESYISYYKKAFNHLLTENLAKKSFFLQLCFLGKIKHPEGNLVEASEACFKQMKKYLPKVNVVFHQRDLIKTIGSLDDVDFVSLSDVPSYFSGDLEKNFVNKLKNSLSDDGLLVNRNYLRVPEADRSGFSDISGKFKKSLNNESVQMYRVEVLKHEI